MPASQDLLPGLIRGSRKALFLAARWRLFSYSNSNTVILSCRSLVVCASGKQARKNGKNVGERTLNDRGLSCSKSEAISLARMHAYGMGQGRRDPMSLPAERGSLEKAYCGNCLSKTRPVTTFTCARRRQSPPINRGCGQRGLGRRPNDCPRQRLIVELQFVGLIDCPQHELSRVLCVFPCLSVDGITGMTRKKGPIHTHSHSLPPPTPPLRRINRYPRVDGFSRDLGVEACSHTETTRCSSSLLWVFWAGGLLV
jgi:hypothetical protein